MFDKSGAGTLLSGLLHTQEHSETSAMPCTRSSTLAGGERVCAVEAKNNLCVAQPAADGGVLAQQSPERSRAERDESCASSLVKFVIITPCASLNTNGCKGT